jgi:hypothetical protein
MIMTCPASRAMSQGEDSVHAWRPLPMPRRKLCFMSKPAILAVDDDLARDGEGFIVTGHDLSGPASAPRRTLPRPPFALEMRVPGASAAGGIRPGPAKRAAQAAGEGAAPVSFVHPYLAAS